MANEVLMPKLGASMESGTILQWFKEEGEVVSAGDMLFEVMTDKVNIELEAEASGVLLKKLYVVNDEVPVNQVIAYIGQEGESLEVSDRENGSDETAGSESVASYQFNNNKESKDSRRIRATPAARKLARDHNIDLHMVDGNGPRGRIQLDDVKEFMADSETKTKATPLATKIAKAEQVDLSNIKGTGIRGKIMSEDVLSQRPADAERGVKEKIRVEGVRKVVAKRMVESAFTAPHVTITTEVDMTSVKDMREKLLNQIEKQTGYRLSYTEIIIKAVASSLKNHPMINSSLQDDYIVLHSNINIGLAVATPNGLVVPVLRDCDKKGLTELTEESKRLGQLARDNKLNLEQMNGGTFTISNLGMYAVDAFSPIINQPESAILGVGRVQEKPVGVNGLIQLRPMMTLSLSFDHRVIDGAPAAAFLTELKETLENPLAMLA